MHPKSAGHPTATDHFGTSGASPIALYLPRAVRANALLRGLAKIQLSWTGLLWASLVRSSTHVVQSSFRAAVKAGVTCGDVKQLERMSGDFHASVARGERAGRCHAGAVQRIDAALYELDQLKDELSAVLGSASEATTIAKPVEDRFDIRAAPAAALRSAA